jgi:outer membrane protein TolC
MLRKRWVRRGVTAAATMLLLTPGLLAAAPMAAQEEGGAETQRLELGLLESVELALRHNLQVRIASMSPDVSEEQIRVARGAFDPLLIFNLPQTFNRSTQPQSSVLGGADVLTQELVSTGFSLQANTTWGLGWSFAANAQRFVTNNEFTTFNPRYDTSVRLDVRQPLLRNFGDANTRQLRVSQNDFSVSQEAFRQQLQQGVLEVIQNYWNLVFQYRAQEIAEQNLDLAREQLRRNNTMVRIGVLAAVDVIQTEQQVADAELSVIQARIALANQQDTVKRLLNLDAVVPEGWEIDIIPTTDPETDAAEIDVDAAVAEALTKSPDIRQDRINLDSRRIDLSAANNQILPSVDLVGSIQLNGLGGDRLFRDNSFGGSIIEVQTGGLTESFQQLASADFRNWSVGLQIQVPLRNDIAQAQRAQATIRERQAGEQVRDRELLIRLLVKNAARNIQGGRQQVVAAQNALTLAERQYAGELRLFETGTSSTFQVLSFQRQLTLARQRQLAALIGLNQSLANFEQVRGTLLERYGIEVDDAGIGGPMRRTSAPPVPRAAAASQGRED